MISSSAAAMFSAHLRPRPCAINSASALFRALARVRRKTARKTARPAVDLGSVPASAARVSSRIASAVMREKSGFRGRISASTSCIAYFLELIDQVDRLPRRQFVGADSIQHLMEGVNARLLRFWPVLEQRQVIEHTADIA